MGKSSSPCQLNPCQLKKKMGKKNFYILLYILLAGTVFLSATACSGTHEPEPIEPEYPNTVQLYIAVPQGGAGTRIGDPGSSTGEGIDWDHIAVMIEYVDAAGNLETTEGTSGTTARRIVKTLSKEEFDALPDVAPATATTTTVTKLFSIGVYPGKVHIYGVTYHSGADGNPASEIEARLAGGKKSNESFSTITISNDYASNDPNTYLARFLSVATGYYKDAANGDNRIFEIRLPGGLQPPIPTMRLTRLAAKIDIQWDAADAYPTYKDVKVEKFTFVGNGNGTAGSGGSTGDTGDTSDGGSTGNTGSGRLFPDLNKSAEPLSGSKTFFNQTPVSQRNGRVYHYVFPDGVSWPKVTFHLSGTKTDEESNGGINKDYTFSFQHTLRQAVWYKINTTIQGLDGTQTDISISFDGN